MRIRSIISAAITVWAIALPLAAVATAKTTPQQENSVELQRPSVARGEKDTVLEDRHGRVPLFSNTTTVFVVRHAEKELNPPYCEHYPPRWGPPCLTAEGKARARQLSRLLQLLEPAKESAVYSTRYDRTLETAQPTADLFGVGISYYEQPVEVANRILQQQLGKRVLVVSHSGWLRQIVKHLGAPEGSCEIAGEYDTLCIVTLSGTDFAGFVHLHYGRLGAKADLVVEALRWRPAQPLAGDTVTFTATVKNVGAAAAAACTLSLKASWRAAPQMCDVPALTPGQSEPVSCPVGGAVAGRQHATAEADAGGTVLESDESNNERRSYFYVHQSISPLGECDIDSDCGSAQLWRCCEAGTPRSYCVRKPQVCR